MPKIPKTKTKLELLYAIDRLHTVEQRLYATQCVLSKLICWLPRELGQRGVEELVRELNENKDLVETAKREGAQEQQKAAMVALLHAEGVGNGEEETTESDLKEAVIELIRAGELGDWVETKARVPERADADCRGEVWVANSSGVCATRYNSFAAGDCPYWRPTGLVTPEPPMAITGVYGLPLEAGVVVFRYPFALPETTLREGITKVMKALGCEFEAPYCFTAKVSGSLRRHAPVYEWDGKEFTTNKS